MMTEQGMMMTERGRRMTEPRMVTVSNLVTEQGMMT